MHADIEIPFNSNVYLLKTQLIYFVYILIHNSYSYSYIITYSMAMQVRPLPPAKFVYTKVRMRGDLASDLCLYFLYFTQEILQRSPACSRAEKFRIVHTE